MIQKIDHIGIAVESIDDAVDFYSKTLGLGEPVIETVEDQKVRTAMFRVGEVRVELLEPVSDDSPISKFLKKRGTGIHHIAYNVDNIEKSLEKMKNDGVRLIDEIPRKGTEGQLIAFIHPKSSHGVLVELCQNIP